jgi:hypothetical protein
VLPRARLAISLSLSSLFGCVHFHSFCPFYAVRPPSTTSTPSTPPHSHPTLPALAALLLPQYDRPPPNARSPIASPNSLPI